MTGPIPFPIKLEQMTSVYFKIPQTFASSEWEIYWSYQQSGHSYNSASQVLFVLEEQPSFAILICD